MKLFKKIKEKFSKAKDTYAKFVEIIKARLANENPTTEEKIAFYTLGILSGFAGVAITFLGLPASIPIMIGSWLPFSGFAEALVVTLVYTLPVSIFIADVIHKITVVVLAPSMRDRITPIATLLSWPKTIIMAINALLGTSSLIYIGTVNVVINTLNKVVWLVESLVTMPVELIRTGGIGGFKTNMRAWFQSWKPSLFQESSLGSVTAKQFRMEEKAKERARKMDPVTPQTA